MEEKDKTVQFKIIQVKTDQFAVFEENYLQEGEINLTTTLTYGLDSAKRQFLMSAKFTFEMNGKPFVSTQVSCFFEIESQSWKNFISEDGILIPKEFLRHMAIITVGTSRGVFHTKTEGTAFNKYILPTINVSALLPDDAVFKDN